MTWVEIFMIKRQEKCAKTKNLPSGRLQSFYDSIICALLLFKKNLPNFGALSNNIITQQFRLLVMRIKEAKDLTSTTSATA
jgi:hypothetical protein